MNAKGVTRLSQNWYVVSTTNMTRKIIQIVIVAMVTC